MSRAGPRGDTGPSVPQLCQPWQPSWERACCGLSTVLHRRGRGHRAQGLSSVRSEIGLCVADAL